MTKSQIDLVQTSFELLKPIAGDLALTFYMQFAELDPCLSARLRKRAPGQSFRLMRVVTLAIHGLKRVREISPMLEDVGARQAACGMTDRHYSAAGACLMWTLERTLGQDFDSELRDAWAAAYTLLSSAMKRGAMAAIAAAA